MKHSELRAIIREEVTRILAENNASGYNGIERYTGALEFPDSAKAALTEVIETVFKKPKYSDIWVKGQFGHCSVGFKIKPNPASVTRYSMSLDLTPEGFLINPSLGELDKMGKKYGGQWKYGAAVGDAVSSGKISKKEIAIAIKDLENIFDRIIAHEQARLDRG